MKWFRRGRRPEPVARLSAIDAVTASAWGKTETEWKALTPEARALCRAEITHAPRFAPN